MDKEKYRAMFSNSNWDFATLQAADEITDWVGKEYFKLDTYPNQIEIVTSEQMLDAYALVGLPTTYPHWKFGKDFVMNQNSYQKGRMGLSYEMVINSNPCVSYNMENNTTCMMVLVIAHACQGHNAFFKNNYLFKEWTSAESILDYMVFARDFVVRCEDEFGWEEVEGVLDACHALMDFGVDKYKKPSKLSSAKEEARLRRLAKVKAENYNDLLRTLPEGLKKQIEVTQKKAKFPKEPEENILYFIEKNAPKLPVWKRELIRIVRKVAQYYYPQGMTKVMNEGFATFMHYHIINKLFDEGYLDDGFMLEFLKSHSGVIYQPQYNSPHFSGLNPYTLGFNIFMDIKRICQEPTDEDRNWFPNLIGKDWLEEVHVAMENFRDDSFIAQYLSPKVMRDMRLFSVLDDEDEEHYEITSIHNERGYRKIREALSKQHDRSSRVPNIQVENVDTHKTSKLTLIHKIQNDRLLEEDEAEETIRHLRYLWEFPVELHSRNRAGIDEDFYEC
ncbi:SpoVR family protein [Tunicatimonas pelagia]|uniref:SpoVR family protein n=1 Tax=Tunicatimonas pelagia TaxID=931531 RepID=UPI00266653EE|nr:SpoVR family protein [Tunicatimonas pelagia]WKN43228.1 SpoVR family protein [Tunicatimonas pelagia]